MAPSFLTSPSTPNSNLVFGFTALFLSQFFNPVHWALLGLPTDADAARLILQRRAASGQTVKTLRDFKHAEKREFRHAQEKFEMPKFDKDLSRTDNFKIFGASFFNESKRRFGQAKEVSEARLTLLLGEGKLVSSCVRCNGRVKYAGAQQLQL